MKKMALAAIEYFHLEKAIGATEYFVRPGLRKATWSLEWRVGAKAGGPFNSQQGRTDAVAQILRRMGVQVIVETGTSRGTTTQWFARNFSDTQVHSVEFQPRVHAFAKARLRRQRNVTLHLGRSQEVLERLAMDKNFPKERVFFYLDAHYGANIPVPRELDIATTAFKDSVIMIDDFAVPGDSYSYIDLGPGLRLDETALAADVAALPRFYPSIPAYQETGYNTGWVVLATGKAVDAVRGAAGVREFVQT